MCFFSRTTTFLLKNDYMIQNNCRLVTIRIYSSRQWNWRPPAVELNQISVHNRPVVQPERLGRLMEPPHLPLQLRQDTAHGRARLRIRCIHPQASDLTPTTN